MTDTPTPSELLKKLRAFHVQRYMHSQTLHFDIPDDEAERLIAEFAAQAVERERARCAAIAKAHREKAEKQHYNQHSSATTKACASWVANIAKEIERDIEGGK